MSIQQTLYVQLFTKSAQLPKRCSSHAAGCDIYSAETTTIAANSRKLISTGIAIEIPQNHYGRIAPRSSLAVNYGIQVGAGVIDSDYRGEVKILLFNHGTDTFEIKQGDRIAQLIVEKISMPVIQERIDLTETVRGQGGFGSTGKN